MIRILVADDHNIVRKGFVSLLTQEHELSVVGEAETGQQAIALVRQLTPDLVLLDITLPDLSGIEVTKRIREISPYTRVLILSMHSEKVFVLQSLQAGASGYLLKFSQPKLLFEAIHQVYAGKHFLSPEISTQGFTKDLHQQSENGVLTKRELQVLRLIAEGLTNKGVAGELSISVKTAENHRKNLMNKLNLHNTASLVRYAIDNEVL
ncbi:MAG: response regulator transcription factor [Acidobacteriota bacterium]